MTLITDDLQDGRPAAQAPDRLRKRVVVLINKRGGTLKKGDLGSFKDDLAAAFERHGLAAECLYLDGRQIEEAAKAAVTTARERGIDAVVVGGGDGTIGTVAGVLSGSTLPLGIVPLGTLNHFARDAGIPGDIDGAVQLIATWTVHEVDVGEVNGKIFINNSSVGIYPSLVVRRDRARWSDMAPKWLATTIAGLTILKQFPLHRLSIFAHGAHEPVRTSCLFVGNNHYELGAAELGQRKHLDEGELCLFVAKQQSRIALLWLALRAFLGLLDRTRDLRALCVVEAEIRSRKSRLFVSRDGEVEIMRSPLTYRARPSALRVLGPPPAPPE